MIEVISVTKHKNIKCKECNRFLSYHPSDVSILYSDTNYLGWSVWTKGFNCPNCKSIVITEVRH